MCTSEQSVNRWMWLLARWSAVWGLVLCGCTGPASGPAWVYYPEPPDPPRVVHLASFNGVDDILPRSTDWLSAVRPRLPRPRVGTPQGLAYRDPSLYICDTYAGCVHVWNLETGETRVLDGFGKPVGVAVDGAGRVFVADTLRNEVVTYDSIDTRAPRRLPVDGRPVRLAVDGDQLHVVDTANHRLLTVSIATGSPIDQEERFAGADPPLAFPVDVAVGPSGSVYVADMMTGRVQVFGAEAGEAKTALGRPGDHYGCLGQPKAVACAPDGTVFVADALFSCIHLFRPDGTLLLVIGGARDAPGGSPMPNGLAVTGTLPVGLGYLVPPDFEPAAYLWVSNTTGSRRLSLFAVGHVTSADMPQ